MRTLRYLRLVEFVVWVGAASGAVIAGSLFLGLLIGRDLLTGKYIMFGVGFLLFGIGTFMIQPTRPHERAAMRRSGSRGSGGGGPPTGDDGGESPDRLDPDVDISTLRKRVQSEASRQHRFEARVQDVGPLAGQHLPFEARIGRGPKVFVTSLVVLGFSLAMEVVGVQV